MATNGHQETPLLSLLSVLTTSIHTIEEELKGAGMPTFTLDPMWHPLDSLDSVPPPRLHEARRVAMAASNMIKALVQDVGTAMMVRKTSFTYACSIYTDGKPRTCPSRPWTRQRTC